jgi:hypothetical protein
VPRPRKNASAGSPSLSHGQASYVLDRLLRDRHISQYDVQRYVNDMGREINELQSRLDSLRQAHGGGTGAAAPAARRPGRPPGRPGRPPGRGPGRPPGRPGRPPGRRPGRPPASAAAPAAAPAAAAAAAPSKKGGKRRSAITPEQLASRQLQGRYLALIRQIPASRRGQYAKTAKDKGREAAIKDMQDAIKK